MIFFSSMKKEFVDADIEFISLNVEICTTSVGQGPEDEDSF